jgi:DNA-directed RNA polymerase specialized sigma24 family protein
MSESSLNAGTITLLLRQLPTKDEQVVQDVFNFYFQDLARRAKRLLTELGGVRVTDDEDLAILVITAFLKDATQGELGELRSRHDVWRMLSKRIRLRAINMVRDERRSKKMEMGESVFRNADGGWDTRGIDQQPGRDVQELTWFHQELIGALSDPVEKEIAALLLEGKDVQEISNKLTKSPATVYRKLQRIKESWESQRNQMVKA